MEGPPTLYRQWPVYPQKDQAMKTFVYYCVMAALCVFPACENAANATDVSQLADSQEEVDATYIGLYRHPCSGHMFREVDGNRTFFSESDWDPGSFGTGTVLHLTYETLPISELSCNILPVPDEIRYIRILSAEE